MAREDLLINVAVQNQQALGKLGAQLNGLQKNSFGLGKALKLAAAGFAAIGAARLVGGLINTIRTFEDLQATLKTVQGSTEAAASAFDLIRKFTAGTTFQLAEVSQGFITLRNAGLNPTQKMMTDLGNIAAGMGKRFDDVARAVFNATTGEFEMLKQLGIKVKVQGDKLEAQFRGTTIKLNNNAEEILGLLQKIGAEDFEGAIEERANTLSGAFSNFGDAIAETAMKLGEGGLKDELTAAARGLTGFINENEQLIASIGKFLGATVGLLIDALALIAKAFITVADGVGTVVDGIVNFGTTVMKYIPFIDKQTKALDATHRALMTTDRAYQGVNQELKDNQKQTAKSTETTDKNTDATKKAIVTYKFYDDAINRVKRSNQAAEKSQKDFEDAVASDAILSALNQVIGEGFTPLQGKITAIASGMNTFRDTASSSLTDVIMGTKSLSDALGEIVNNTLRALIQGFINLGITIFILEPLERFLRNQVRTQKQLNSELRTEIGLRTVLAFLTGGASLFGGFRATGGPVSQNQSYIVGERGPEIFVPNSSGMIIPNNEVGVSDGGGLGGGGDNIDVTFNINTIDASDFDSLLTDRQDLIIGLINRGLAERGKRSLTA